MQPLAVLVTSTSRGLAEPVVRAFAGQLNFYQLKPPPVPFCAQVKTAPPHICQLGDYSMTSAPLVDVSKLTPDEAVQSIRAIVAQYEHGPGLVTMGKSVLGDLIKWSAVKFGRCSPEQIEKRLVECRICPYWEPEAFKGTGRCKKCGCSTWGKLKLKSASCPDGRWAEINIEEATDIDTINSDSK
jgi:hypothetical protein